MKLLFDVNTLLSRFDANHIHHMRVSTYLDSLHELRIHTCPITENGFLRIFSHPSYPSGPGNMPEAYEHLCRIRSIPGHVFVHDNLSLCEHGSFPDIPAASPKQLTDLYLLALAVRHGIRFATLDKKIPAHLIPGGSDACLIIP